MSAVLKVLLALLLSVPLAFLGWALARDPGRLSVHFWGWQIDTTLVLALIVLALAVFLWWLLVSIVWRLPRHFLRKRQKNLAQQFLNGLGDFSLGNFQRAKRRLLEAAARSDQAGLALLHASYASASLAQPDEAIRLAQRALQHAEVKDAARVWLAELALLGGDASKLDELRTLAEAGIPKASLALSKALSERGRASEAMQALQTLQKQLPGAAAKDWASMARLSLKQAATVEQLEAAWDALGEREQALGDVLASYAEASVNLDDQNGRAFERLMQGLRDQYSETLCATLVRLAPKLSPEQRQSALKWAERADQKGGSDAQGLQLALARLYRLQQQSTPAKSHLQRAIELGAGADAQLELAESELAAGDFHAAALAYQRALAG